jgi:phosphoribosylglycinamide formyltransferase-1
MCTKIGEFMKRNVAILASGNGSNAENIIRFFEQNEEVSIPLIVTNRADAGVIARAERLGVSCVYHPKADWKGGEAVLKSLKEADISFIVLAGFLLRVPQTILQAYPNGVINIHPALLPKYGGKGMYGDHVHEAVIAAGERESGITIHYVNEQYDKGAIIRQVTCPVLADDTPDTLATRIHGLEYEFFPKVIEEVLNT